MAAREPVVATLGTGWVRWVYEATMMALALAVVYLLTLPDEGWVRAANLAIWGVFIVDYSARLALSSDRRGFVKANIPDLIAILPLDFLRVARLARLARLVRLLRAGTVLWRASKDIRGILTTNGLSYVLGVTLVTIVGGAAAIRAAGEPALDSFGDALWWSMVTATTVGYGDISPETAVGRVVAAAIMLVGIGTIGMVTGSIATYFLSDEDPDLPPDVEHVRQRLTSWNDLRPGERQRLVALLDSCTDET